MDYELALAEKQAIRDELARDAYEMTDTTPENEAQSDLEEEF